MLQRQIDSGCNKANEKLAINIQLHGTAENEGIKKDNWIQNKRSYYQDKMQMVQWRWKKFKIFPKYWKRHYKNGAISQLKFGETEFASSDKEILSECVNVCNVKPFIEIFIAPKQIAIIHELTAYFSETMLQIIEPRGKRKMWGHGNQSRVLTSFKKYETRKKARLGWFAHRIL